MALIIPPGFAQVVYKFSLAGDPEKMVVTCGRDVSGLGGVDQADVDTMAGYFTTSTPASFMSSDYTYEGCTVYVGQDGAPPIVWESSASTHQVGTATSPSLPQNCAFLVRKNTATGGRRGRGRMYIPPFWFAESTIDAKGYIATTQLDAMQTKVSNWFAGSGWRLLHSDGLTATPAPTEITSFIVQPQIATQRRRLRP